MCGGLAAQRPANPITFRQGRGSGFATVTALIPASWGHGIAPRWEAAGTPMVPVMVFRRLEGSGQLHLRPALRGVVGRVGGCAEAEHPDVPRAENGGRRHVAAPAGQGHRVKLGRPAVPVRLRGRADPRDPGPSPRGRTRLSRSAGNEPEPGGGPCGTGLTWTGRQVWAWLAAPAHRALLGLWVEGYALSLRGEPGPWAGFATDTVNDWLELLAARQPASRRNTPAGQAERTLLLAVPRGGLLDLLATGDTGRITSAVESHLRHLERPRGE